MLACTHPAAAPAPAPPAGSGSSALAADGWQLDRSSFDTTAAPCTDFYQYVCGGFVAHAQIPDDNAALDWERAAAIASNNEILQALLTGTDAPKPEDASDLTRLRTFYASCMAGGDAPERTLATWLAVIDGIKARGDVQPALRKLHQAGFAIIFQYSGEPDPAVRTRYRGQLGQGEFGARRIYGDKGAEVDALRAAYAARVETVLALSGEPAAQARADARTVLDLEGQLVRAALRRDEINDPAVIDHPTPPAALAKLAPHVDWTAYLAMVGYAAGDPLNVSSPKYLKFADAVLATRPIADLRAYFRWRLLDELGGALPDKLAAQAYLGAASHGVARPARADECRLETLKAMGVELSRQFAARALGPAARDQAVADVQQVQAEIATAVASTPWLSPAARTATATKMTTMLLKVGFPTAWPATDTAPVSPDDVLANVLAARTFQQAQSWKRARAERRRESWENIVYPNEAAGMAAARLTIPNAFPDLLSNSILFTAAFIRAPIYDARAPLEVRLGGFGAVAGHEITHALDFHQLDDHGEFHDAFTPDDVKAYNAQLACEVKAAGAFTVQGVHLDGEATINENNADYGGVRHAYAALAKVRAGKLADKGADGFTEAQRFFIGYAQHWCEAVRPAQEVAQMREDHHAPARFRVNGPLASLPAFAQAFACPAGSPMAPPAAERCTVW